MQSIHALPAGYNKVSVVLSDKELVALRREASLTGEGTYSAAIRLRMGLKGEAPYGLKAALKRLLTR